MIVGGFHYICRMKVCRAEYTGHARWRRVALVGVNALVLVLLTLAGNSLPYDLGGEGALMKRLDVARQALGMAGADMGALADRFLAVNVGYDRELVPAYDEFGIPAGERAVVSRGRLAQLLDSLDGAPYKCILLDVQFFKSDVTEADSALFAAINRMPRLATAYNPDDDAVDAIAPDRFAAAEYGITIDENNFVKYTFDRGDMPGMALAAYNIAGGRDVRLSGRCPTDSGRPANGSLCLSLPYRMESGYDAEGEKLYYNLGADLLDVYDRGELAALAAGKTVVIGDYVGGDDHDTYAGSMQGPVIIMNAVMALEQGRHLVNLWWLAVMFAVYALVVLFMMSDAARMLPFGLGRLRIWRFAATFVSFSTVVVVMNVAAYLATGVMYDLYFPTLYLTVLYFVIEHNISARVRRRMAALGLHGKNIKQPLKTTDKPK